jgi:hypothetical protein
MARAMDDAVLRSMAKWPNVPDVYGWLSLDRRGNWLLRGERIGNVAVREFMARNYQPDERGCWFFQNGPQRVFVELAYTPLVVRLDGQALFDHCGRPFAADRAYLDDEGSVLMLGEQGLGLLDDRDLAAYADRAQNLPQVTRAGVPKRFGFVRIPSPGILARA